MRLRTNAIRRNLLVGPAAFAMAILLLAGFGMSRAHAGGTDLSGTWSIHYLLSCDVSITQSGSAISGTVDCAEFQGTLQGTYDSTSRDLSLSGSIESAVPFTAQGTVGSSGRSMAGTFTAAPYVPNGSFNGDRMTGDASDLTGDWTLSIDGVFSGNCSVDVEHRGSSVEASGACGPVSSLSGTFNSSTNAISLEGPILNTTLQINGTVSNNGNSIDGTWEVTVFTPPLHGVIRAQRISGPPPTVTPVAGSHATPAATATVAAAALPGTGGGTSNSTGFPTWAYAAMILGGGAVLLAGARYGRQQV